MPYKKRIRKRKKKKEMSGRRSAKKVTANVKKVKLFLFRTHCFSAFYTKKKAHTKKLYM